MNRKLNIVIIGLTLTSLWGNRHAVIYRNLLRELNKRGHNILFLEQDVKIYAENRDLPDPPFCKIGLYQNTDELKSKYLDNIISADLVIVGSRVADGVEIGWHVQKNTKGICAFYDIDTPSTISKLRNKDYEYLAPEQVPYYDIYLSLTGGPTLDYLHSQFNSPLPKPFYYSIDPEIFYPENEKLKWDLGYIGTYNKDRHILLQKFLFDAADVLKEKKFIVAGSMYPDTIVWPKNIAHEIHLLPDARRQFYSAQKFTLNFTHSDMIEAGYSPGVRIFEAAACGTPIISDKWTGIEDFLEPDSEILIAEDTEDVIEILKNYPENKRKEIAEKAKKKILENHTSEKRSIQLEEYYEEAAVADR